MSSSQVYYPYGSIRATTGSVPTDFGFTGQRFDASDSLMYYGARYYDAALGRFISADTVVPGNNPQGLNRYSYAINNPLTYTDPTGHCVGDANDPNNPDAGCWMWITKIEGTYKNTQIDPRLWKEDELQAVWDALLGHVFITDILKASAINLFRRNFFSSLNDGIAGKTDPLGQGVYNVTIFDFAYRSLPDASGAGTSSIRNFEGTVIHELAHVAMHEDPFILESHALRSDLTHYLDNLLPRTFGQAYNYSTCDGHREEEIVAIAAATWQVMPESFSGRFLWISYTDWHKEWIGLFYHPNPLVPQNYDPTSIGPGH